MILMFVQVLSCANSLRPGGISSNGERKLRSLVPGPLQRGAALREADRGQEAGRGGGRDRDTARPGPASLTVGTLQGGAEEGVAVVPENVPKKNIHQYLQRG